MTLTPPLAQPSPPIRPLATAHGLLWLCTLAACGGGGGAGPAATPPPPAPAPAPAPAPGDQELQVTGPDTSEFGTRLSLPALAYGREDLTGAPWALIAATNSAVLQVLLNGGELPPVSGTVAALVAGELGISMRISRDNYSRSWLYLTEVCSRDSIPVPCGDIVVDRAARTITFHAATVQPVIGGEDSSLATAPLVITGTLRWTEADE